MDEKDYHRNPEQPSTMAAARPPTNCRSARTTSPPSKETCIWQTPPFSASTRIESNWRTQLTFYTRLAFGTRIPPYCFQRTRAPRTLLTRVIRKHRNVQFLVLV